MNKEFDAPKEVYLLTKKLQGIAELCDGQSGDKEYSDRGLGGIALILQESVRTLDNVLEHLEGGSPDDDEH